MVKGNMKNGFNAVVAIVIGVLLSLVLITFCVIIPGMQDKQRRNDMRIVQSAVREYMRSHKNQPLDDSGSELSDGELNVGGTMRTAKILKNSTESHILDGLTKSDLAKSGLTKHYYVANPGLASDVSTVAWQMSDSQMGPASSESVFIYIGGRCSDDKQDDENLFLVSNTGLKTDIISFRLLHRGGWTCANL